MKISEFYIGTFSGDPEEALEYGVPEELTGCHCRAIGAMNQQYCVLSTWVDVLKANLMRQQESFRIKIAHVNDGGERHGLHVAYFMGPHNSIGLSEAQLDILKNRCTQLSIWQFSAVLSSEVEATPQKKTKEQAGVEATLAELEATLDSPSTVGSSSASEKTGEMIHTVGNKVVGGPFANKKELLAYFDATADETFRNFYKEAECMQEEIEGTAVAKRPSLAFTTPLVPIEKKGILVHYKEAACMQPFIEGPVVAKRPSVSFSTPPALKENKGRPNKQVKTTPGLKNTEKYEETDRPTVANNDGK